jgi:hypothetical protein
MKTWNERLGMKDLEEKRLKISEIMSLNDPFEFLRDQGVRVIDPADCSGYPIILLIFRCAFSFLKNHLNLPQGCVN